MTVPMALSAADRRVAYTLIASVWSYGPVALLCSLAGRLLWSRGHERLAVGVIALPLWMLAILLFLLGWGLLEAALR